MGVILSDNTKPVYTGDELYPNMMHNAVQNHSFNLFLHFCDQPKTCVFKKAGMTKLGLSVSMTCFEVKIMTNTLIIF